MKIYTFRFDPTGFLRERGFDGEAIEFLMAFRDFADRENRLVVARLVHFLDSHNLRLLDEIKSLTVAKMWSMPNMGARTIRLFWRFLHGEEPRIPKRKRYSPHYG